MSANNRQMSIQTPSSPALDDWHGWRRVIPTCINCNQQHTVSQGLSCRSGQTSLLHRTDESTYYDFAPDKPEGPVGAGGGKPLERQTTGWWTTQGEPILMSPLSLARSTSDASTTPSQVWVVTITKCSNGVTTTTTARFLSLIEASSHLTNLWDSWSTAAGENGVQWTPELCNSFFSLENLYMSMASLLPTSQTVFVMPSNMGSPALESLTVNITSEF